MRLLTTMLFVFMLIQTAVAQEGNRTILQPNPVKEEASARETKVFRIENLAVRELAKALSDILEPQLQKKPKHNGIVIESPVVIVPEITTNSLLVSATTEYMKQITALIDQLDKKPQQIRIDLVIQEVDAEGNVTTISRPSIITVEGRKATIEIGGETGKLKIEATPALIEKIGEQ